MHLKKLILAACLNFTLLTGLRAQHSPWSISVSGGATLPVGKFAGKHFGDTTESFARLGPVLNLMLEYRLHAQFGWALSFTGQENYVDINSMEQQVNPPTTDTTISRTTVSSGSWYIGKIMTGPTLSLPMGRKKKWYFTSRLMAGVLRTAEPKLAIGTGTEYIVQGPGLGSPGGGLAAYTASYSYQGKISLPWTLAWLGSAGVLYPINAKWSFRVDVDYSTATIRAPFNTIHHGAHAIYSFSGGNGLPIVITPLPYNHFYSLPVSSVNLNMGVKMRL